MIKRASKHRRTLILFALPIVFSFIHLTSHAQKYARYETEDIRGTDGTWKADIRKHDIQFFFRKPGYTGSGVFGGIFPSSEFKSLPRTEAGFSLKRAAGTLEFTGKFTGQKGEGTYHFHADSAFRKQMNDLGIALYNDKDQMTFMLVNVTPAYVQMLKANGFRPTKDDIVSSVATGVDDAYIRCIRAAGFSHITLGELTGFKSLGIDEPWLAKMRKAGNVINDAGTAMALKAKENN